MSVSSLRGVFIFFDPRNNARCRVDLQVRVRANSFAPSCTRQLYIWQRSYRMTWDRLYSSARWRKLTRAFLRMHPVCDLCTQEGQTYEATIVHHLVEYRPGDPDAAFWLGPFQAVCKKHHLQIHGWPAMREYDTAIGLDGLPLDRRNHPFWEADRKQQERERKWQDSAGKKATP